MNARSFARLLAVLVACVSWSALAVAQQPGYPKGLATGPRNLGESSPPNGFLGLGLATETEAQKERPVVCFGMRQVGDKNKYTYFIIFKTDRTKKWDLGSDVGIDGLIFLGGAHQATLAKLYVRFGEDKKIVISYKLEANKKTGDVVKEALTIAGEVYKKDGPRVFLCDLTAEKPTCKPLNVALPGSAPKVGGDAEALSAALIQSLQEVAKKSPEVKEIFEGPAKK